MLKRSMLVFSYLMFRGRPLSNIFEKFLKKYGNTKINIYPLGESGVLKLLILSREKNNTSSEPFSL